MSWELFVYLRTFINFHIKNSNCDFCTRGKLFINNCQVIFMRQHVTTTRAATEENFNGLKVKNDDGIKADGMF